MTTTMPDPVPAPTPIATFEDILEAMERDPRLQKALQRYALDEQYRELPGAVAQLTANIQELTAVVHRIVGRQDRLESIVARMVERQDRLEAAVAELAAAVAGIAERQDRLEAAMAELVSIVARLDAANLVAKVTRMEGHVGRLAGIDYEGYINKGIATRMRAHLNFRQARIIHNASNSTRAEGLEDVLGQPLDDGVITPQEGLAILDADFVVSGVRNGQPAYALGETSRPIHRSDITRARERADLLAKATNVATFAVAVGPDEPAPENRQLAERLDVIIVIAPDPSEATEAE